MGRMRSRRELVDDPQSSGTSLKRFGGKKRSAAPAAADTPVVRSLTGTFEDTAVGVFGAALDEELGEDRAMAFVSSVVQTLRQHGLERDVFRLPSVDPDDLQLARQRCEEWGVLRPSDVAALDGCDPAALAHSLLCLWLSELPARRLWKMSPARLDDGAPSASLDDPKAPTAPSYAGASPEQPGGSA